MKWLHRIAHALGLGWNDQDADWFHVYDHGEPGTFKVCNRCGRIKRQS